MAAPASLSDMARGGSPDRIAISVWKAASLKGPSADTAIQSTSHFNSSQRARRRPRSVRRCRPLPERKAVLEEVRSTDHGSSTAGGHIFPQAFHTYTCRLSMKRPGRGAQVRRDSDLQSGVSTQFLRVAQRFAPRTGSAASDRHFHAGGTGAGAAGGISLPHRGGKSASEARDIGGARKGPRSGQRPGRLTGRRKLKDGTDTLASETGRLTEQQIWC